MALNSGAIVFCDHCQPDDTRSVGRAGPLAPRETRAHDHGMDEPNDAIKQVEVLPPGVEHREWRWLTEHRAHLGWHCSHDVCGRGTAGLERDHPHSCGCAALQAVLPIA